MFNAFLAAKLKVKSPADAVTTHSALVSGATVIGPSKIGAERRLDKPG